MRIWDGITDPVIGFVVDKSKGKFGKNRPFILIGQSFMLIGTAIVFLVCPKLGKDMSMIVYILAYMFYIMGYTCQCVVTKSAQTCLTNDPEQRPLTGVFDALYGTVIFSFIHILITMVLVSTFNIVDSTGAVVISAFNNANFFIALWIICASISIVFAILAVIGIWRKDREEFDGTGVVERIKISDYLRIIKKNRAIQMLIVSACSDKLSTSMQMNAVVMVMLFGIVMGNYSAYGIFSGVIGLLGSSFNYDY